MISSRKRTRRNSSAVVVGALAALVIGLGGCDGKPSTRSDNVVIDASAESSAKAADASNSKIVTMIMPFGGRNVEMIIWQQAAVEEMGKFVGQTNAILDVRALGADDQPEKQADLVRDAVKRGASALIVVASDPKSIAPALIEARDKGVQVLLLSRPVPIDGNKPFPLVRYPGFDDLAKKMVETGRLVARDREIADNAPAMILLHEPKDDHTDLRIAAFKKALKDAKIPLVAVESFEEYPAKAARAIERVMKKYPDLGYILADEDQGVEATTAARALYNPEKPPIVLGFVWSQKQVALLRSGDVTALVNRKVQGGAARAVKAAVALCRGEPLPELAMQPSLELANDPVEAGRIAVKSFKMKGDPNRR